MVLPAVPIETRALAEAWLSDPEAMTDVDREALLDWVRDRVDAWRLRALEMLILLPLPVDLLISIDIHFGPLRRTDGGALCEEAGVAS